MNTPILLNSDLLDEDVAAIATGGQKFIQVFGKNNQPASMPDFGTVLIGFASRQEAEADELMPLFVGDTCIVWFAPNEWKVGHLAKRFGMFPSISQAIKNGFGSDIPVGFSQVQLRVNKLRGVLTIFKKA